MDLPPYSKLAHAHALILSGILLGLDPERVNREVREDTGLDAAKVRVDVVDGNYHPDALVFLAVFDKKHAGILTRTAAAHLEHLLNLA